MTSTTSSPAVHRHPHVAIALTIGPGARLIALKLQAAPGLHIKAWGVRLRSGRVNVLLIDKGFRPVRVGLRPPGYGDASVERLTAPSVRAQFGVALAGQRLDAAGRWVGRRVSQQLAPTRGAYTVSVPATSAALVSLPALRHTLR